MNGSASVSKGYVADVDKNRLEPGLKAKGELEWRPEF
jgi:hypothetical protein